MMNKSVVRNNVIILGVLIVVLLISFSLINNVFENEFVILNDNNLKEESNNNTFALMLEQSDGTYKESSGWPTNMKFNSELSGCIDVDGNRIQDTLSFDSVNNLVNVIVGEIVYCYMYFDLDRDIPIITVRIDHNNTAEVIMVIYSNKEGTYCVNTSSIVSDMSNCLFEGEIIVDEDNPTTAFIESNDYYVHVKDREGNIVISEKQEINVVNDPLIIVPGGNVDIVP